MLVYGIDPGTEQSAIVGWDGAHVVYHATVENETLRHALANSDDAVGLTGMPVSPVVPHVVIEKIESYGMAVGKETFRTVWWSGRFYEVWPWPAARHEMSRKDVKLHLCQSARATDANIRAAILDRFGPGKDKAVGKKAHQGPLYGVVGHEYAALAVALTFRDRATF